MSLKVVITVLVISSIVVFTSCNNPLEERVNDLENELNEQKEYNQHQQEILDSLILELTLQGIKINNESVTRQRIIDSLTILYSGKLDSLEEKEKALIDSLINEQNDIIDSLYNSQQEILESLIENQINSEFTSVEVYNGVPPSSWIDIDLSQTTGKKKTLTIFRINRLSESGGWIVFRPNGETVDWLTDTGNFTNFPSALSITSLFSPKSALVMVYSDDNGVVELKGTTKDNFKVSISLEYYTN